MTRTAAVLAFAFLLCQVAHAARQAPGVVAPPVSQVSQAAPVRTVTFAKAIELARQRNVSALQAAQEILRAQGFLSEATASILPSIGASLANTTLNDQRAFGGSVTTPRNQTAATLSVAALLFAPVQWALRTQAMDTVTVARLSEAETLRQVVQATAQAYLAVIARTRVVEANVRARDVARAHYELARQQREAGAGSVLNEVRAQQQWSSDEVLVRQAQLDMYRAEEALGVLLQSDGPLGAADEPVLDVPTDLRQAESVMPTLRADLLLAQGRERAAARVMNDTWKEWLPSVSGLFQPVYTTPETLFQPKNTWRAQVTATVPIFDFGLRRAHRAERAALFREAQVASEGLLTQARSDVRATVESLRLSEEALASAREAAQQAQRVVEIVNVSFRAGAATNIEVIDAQRAERDADNAAAVAEDQVRQAKLALLIALGRFQ